MQPYRVLGVDAIIVFSDILIVAEAMGMPLDVPDSGPVLSNPVRDAAAVRRLREFDPERETRFVGDAIRAICKEAGPDVPVIGFAAAPWTLACYMIEGQTRGDISRAKRMLREEPQIVRELLERIARATVGYLKAQIEAGAAAVQLFDTWAGELAADEYDEFEMPATQTIFEALGEGGAPRILFAKGSARHLENLAKSGADVLSVDWNTDLAEARRRLGRRVALQGNVDPSILLGDEDGVRQCGARSDREDRRRGPYFEPRTRNFADDTRWRTRGRSSRPGRRRWWRRERCNRGGHNYKKRDTKLEIGQISDEILEKYNRPGPRYTSYPTAPVWKDDFGPGDLEEPTRARMRSRHAAFALHASSLLREPVPFLRVQRFDPEGQERRDPVPRRAEARNRSRRADGFKKAAGDSVPLGRRDADVSLTRADGRSFRLRARAIFVRARRGDWHRNGPARHQPRAPRNSAAPRIQPAEHGHPGFPAQGAGDDPSRAAVRNDARPDCRRARAGLREPERGFDLRIALPDGREFSDARSIRR